MVDVRDTQALETWLATQSGPASALIAARAAARVLPLIGSWRPENAWTEVFIQSNFRIIVFLCVASSRFVSTYPNRDDGIAASFAASSAADYAGVSAPLASRAAAAAASRAAAAAATASISRAAAAAANSAAASAFDAATAAYASDAATAAFRRDVDALEALNLSPELAGAELSLRLSPTARLPLWKGAPPSEIATAWEALAIRLRDLNDGSEVWIDWYEAWRDGKPASEGELAAFALAPEALWTEPRRVNDWITDALEIATRPPKPLKPADLFISYATVDEAFAREVVDVASENGLTTIAQFKDFGVGTNFVTQMQQGLLSDRVVAIYTPEYMQSKHCQAEWSAAYNSDPDGSKRRLIPLLFKKTELGPLQRQVVYTDVSALSGSERQSALRAAISDPGDVADMRQALPDPISVPNATVAVAVDAEGRIAIDLTALQEFQDPNPADLPQFLAAARAVAERAHAHLSSPRFNGRREYGELLEAYLGVLPSQDGIGGDIITADGLVRTIREMLEVDVVIDFFSNAQINRCIESHQALRPHFPILERFYDQVRTGRITTPLPMDAARAIRDTINEHTPEIFAPSVQVFASSNSAPTPAPPLPEERGSPPTAPPQDNSKPVNQGTARAVRFAELVNRIVEVFKFGKVAGDGTKGYLEVMEALKTWGPALIKWLGSMFP